MQPKYSIAGFKWLGTRRLILEISPFDFATGGPLVARYAQPRGNHRFSDRSEGAGAAGALEEENNSENYN